MYIITYIIHAGFPHRRESVLQISKPKLEVRQFKSHTMDNVRVRRMCDELLHLEDQTHELTEDQAKANAGQG